MAKKMATKKNKKWIKGVKTDSTFAPKDTFTKDAETIARVMATKKVSPKGLGSAIRMVQYFINRSGKDLSAAQAGAGEGKASAPGKIAPSKSGQ